MSILDLDIIKGYIRMCTDGWNQGWHERNGGNLTYRMKDEEVAQCRPYFRATPGEWVNMGVQADNLAGEYFITTGSGKYFRNVELDPEHNMGIVEINDKGDSWRIVWGLEGGARPTSEFPSHFMNHSVRKAATNGANRVIYHCHCPNIIALSTLVEPDARLRLIEVDAALALALRMSMRGEARQLEKTLSKGSLPLFLRMRSILRAQTVLAALRNCARSTPPALRSFRVPANSLLRVFLVRSFSLRGMR